ncbi:MAG: DUF488 domain-containing protein [Flavobacteriales bacterium]|nr:DUF488 domain-containing protein [Flavobacteriales bacterium]
MDIDAFLNKLMGAGVTLLCDVRRNAQSMKYGYSKKQLDRYCQSAGIRYLHRHVGIASEKRAGVERAGGVSQALCGICEEISP